MEQLLQIIWQALWTTEETLISWMVVLTSPVSSKTIFSDPNAVYSFSSTSTSSTIAHCLRTLKLKYKGFFYWWHVSELSCISVSLLVGKNNTIVFLVVILEVWTHVFKHKEKVNVCVCVCNGCTVSSPGTIHWQERSELAVGQAGLWDPDAELGSGHGGPDAPEGDYR